VSGYRGTDDRGRVADPLTPETLRPLLWEASTSVLVERVADAATLALARRAATGRWSLEVRSGSAVPLVAEVPNTDAAFDALRSWAAEDGWWQEAFSWRAADPDVSGRPRARNDPPRRTRPAAP
jgi:hypothetical protein